MEKIILIKYGELGTKKGNKKIFINKLYQNIFEKLKDDDVGIKKDFARIYIKLNNNDEDIVINKLETVFGIYSIILGYKIQSNILSIKTNVLSLMSDCSFKTFKVKTKRVDKKFPCDSMSVSKLIGAHVLRNIDNIKVDVLNPDILLNIEIRFDYTYLYIKEIKGLGGYPVGTQGKGLLMLSGGIDSPVAGFLSLKRGVDIEAIYFESPPHTSIEARDKVIKLMKVLSNYNGNMKLHIIPFTKLQEAILKNIEPSYMVTIMRRMMYRIGEELIKKLNAYVLINGESIGQVASQTLTSINVINRVTNIPIIRPLICMDKIEIIGIAKKIKTYEISILPYEDCCTIFIPQHPVINPSLDKCLNFEKKIDYQKLINECINKVETININSYNDNNYKELL